MTSFLSVLINLLLILYEISFCVLGLMTDIQLRDLSNGHTITGDNITLECSITSTQYKPYILWNAPINLKLKNNRVHIEDTTTNISSSSFLTTSIYTIQNSTKIDASIYYCTVTETETMIDVKYKYIWVPVYGVDEHIIQLCQNHISSTKIELFFKAHPETTFHWIDKNNNTISTNSSKFASETAITNIYANYKSSLKFKDVLYEDFGNNTVIATNEYEQKKFTISLNLTNPPILNLTISSREDEFTILKCQSIGFPKPKITWQFKTCKDLYCFQNLDKINASIKHPFHTEDKHLESTSYLLVKKSEFGLVQCNASNTLGSNSLQQYLYKPIEKFQAFSEYGITLENTTTKIQSLFRDNIIIMCAVSLQDYNEEITWHREGRNFSLNDIRVPIKGFDEYDIKNINAVYSTVTKVKFNIDKTDAGNYFCKASRKDGKIDYKWFTIIVREQPTLNVASNMQNNTVTVKYGNSIKFFCNVDGYPTPSIKWYKNDTSLSNSTRIQIKNNNQTLEISDVVAGDNGTYKCDVRNRVNLTETRKAIVKTTEKDFDWLLLAIIILLLALSCVSIFVIVKIRNTNKLKSELKMLGLADFEKGDIENLNPELRLDDQADLLPYDKKWEIPSDKLKLGKELGSGAFGVVVEGELLDFPTKEKKTTVAVKMVNKFADDDCIKALASELKIMVHLGTHINIVNLIGACTQDIAKKKLLVVVEYCSHGNLHNYIISHSIRFIDQRKTDDQFDWNIRPKKNKMKNAKLNYIVPQFDEEADGEIEKSDFVNETDYICSRDFLLWAFQIAQGMDYLSSCRVLHGDLAARNVLLADNNVVKIADFGLARNMYKEGIYKKKANGPLPVKWMAIESIGEGIFSTQSDVWSFGVVLWEIFSLGKTPYPGLPVDQNFYRQLCNGYRMEKPEFATRKIYKMILECWDANPTKRPCFKKLAEIIGGMMEEPLKTFYVNMKTSYVTMRRQQLLDEEPKQNYFSMVAMPNYENIVKLSPCFVNNFAYFNCKDGVIEFQNE